MASLLNQDQNSQSDTTSATPDTTNLTTTNGTGTSSSGSGGSSATNAGSNNSSGSTSSTNNQSQPAPFTGVQDQNNQIASLNSSNNNFQPLLDYVQNVGTNAKGAVNDANSNFTNSIIGTPTFGQDQQNQLSSVISGQSPLSTGQSLLDTQAGTYTPIDNNSYDPLVSQYQTDANNTTTGSGIGTLLAGLNPQETQGDLAYDEAAYTANPNYQTQSQGLVSDANNLQAQAAADTNTSNTEGTTLANQAAAFNQAAKQYVQQQQMGLNQQLIQEQQQAADANINVLNEYNALRNGTGSLSSIPAQYLNFNPAQYAPVNVASQNGSGFNQSVLANPYLTLNQGAPVTVDNVATPDQITQYNNMLSLLGGNDINAPVGGQLTATPYQASNIGINQKAFQAALAQTQAARNNVDAGWLAQQPKA